MGRQIRNCDLRFGYRCPEDWSKLEQTSNVHVRFCTVCEKSVHHCVNLAELMAHAEAGNCVAVNVDSRPRMLMGVYAPDEEFME